MLQSQIFTSVTKPILIRVLCQLSMSKTMETIEEQYLSSLCKKLPPKLTHDRYKGQAGRIGIIGGSLEYTGAPFFSGISALKVGADLSHIFCTRDAATVIKSYSPELIVHPLLDNLESAQKAVEWIERLHVIVVGPGLGRNLQTFEAATVLLTECRRLKKPLIIDADGLFLITNHPHILEDYPAGVILTPNAVEYSRLFNSVEPNPDLLNRFGTNCTVIKKGSKDVIFDRKNKTVCTVEGSARRCGGQGDLLSGSVAVFYCWALSQQSEEVKTDLRAILACYAACKLTRECNARAFKQNGRSMTTSDMIVQISDVFNEFFEIK